MVECRKASDALPPTRRAPVPLREVSLPPGGQNPITLEYQIYPPTIDTIVTGMVLTTTKCKNGVFASKNEFLILNHF